MTNTRMITTLPNSQFMAHQGMFGIINKTNDYGLMISVDHTCRSLKVRCAKNRNSFIQGKIESNYTTNLIGENQNQKKGFNLQ